MKIWFTFQKLGPMVYVSYLDLINVLERSLRRANLPVSYSHGFNPQPKISFAHPLPVGVKVAKDYGEVEFESNCSLAHVRETIDHYLPSGFHITGIMTDLGAKPPKLMSLVKATRYEFHFDGLLTETELDYYYQQALQSHSLVIEKRTPKKTKQKDMRPLIYQLNRQGRSLTAIVQAGSSGNARPDELIKAIFANMELFYYGICIRTEVYSLTKDEELIPLDASQIDN